MFKKLSAALVASSLVAVAQPALAQAINPIFIENLPVIPMGADIQQGAPSLFVYKLNIKYDSNAAQALAPVNTLALRQQFRISRWMVNYQYTAYTYNGVQIEPKNFGILSNDYINPTFCLMSGYLYGYAGIVSKLDCRTDQSFINNKARSWTNF